MPSKFDTLFEACAAPNLDQVFGVSVTLTRDGVISTAFTATYTDRQVELLDSGGGAFSSFTQREFTIKASDYKLTTEAVEPRQNDRITEADSGHVYELMPVPGQQCFELLTGDYRWLVRCKRVKGPDA